MKQQYMMTRFVQNLIALNHGSVGIAVYNAVVKMM